jgi:hypothetical protein
MQRRVLLGAGVAILVIATIAGLNLAGHRQATKALDTDIDRIVASLPPGYTATHGATDVNPITGTLTIRNLAVSRDGKPLWSAEIVTITGANQQALHDVFDPGAYPNGRPAWTAPRLLIADASASGVRIPEEGPQPAEIRIKSVTLHQLRGRPFQSPPTADHVRSPAFRADAALAFALQSLDLHDFTLEAQSARPTKLSVGTLALRDYDAGRLGKAELANVAFDVAAEKPTPVEVHATLAAIDVRDLDATAPLKKLQINDAPGRSTLGGMRAGAFHLSGLDINISPGPRITLASMEAHGSPGAAMPATGDATLQGLTIALNDTPLGPGPAALISAFGMNTFTMTIAIKSTADPATGITKIVDDIALQNLGSLHLSLSTGVRSPAAPDQDPRAALLTTPIDHAILEWHDQGLVNRALNAAAVQMHTSPDAVRAQLAMPLLTLGFLMPDQPDVADQLTSFLNHPNTLSITLDPPQPITFADVGKAPAETRAHLLGAHIQAK